MGLEEFISEFEPKLGKTSRWNGILYIATHLYKLQRNVTIVETGCVRQPNNWSGDGMSTVLWSYIVNDLGGRVTSIDINESNIDVAKTIAPSATYVCGDSIQTLRSLSNADEVDLLYLDSYDFNGSSDAAFHNVCELSCIYPRLRSNCLIGIDDCIDADLGKHVLSKSLLATMDIHPLVSGYVSVWQKR